jgi:hypothetical protein
MGLYPAESSIYFPLHYCVVCHNTQLIVLHSSQRYVNTHRRPCSHSAHNWYPERFTLIALVLTFMLLLYAFVVTMILFPIYILQFYLQGLFLEMFIYPAVSSTRLTHVFFVGVIDLSLLSYAT